MANTPETPSEPEASVVVAFVRRHRKTYLEATAPRSKREELPLEVRAEARSKKILAVGGPGIRTAAEADAFIRRL